MKFLIITLSFLILTLSASAGVYPSKYELIYQKSFLELSGNYFTRAIRIIPSQHEYKLGNETSISAFRNIYAALQTKNFDWFSNNTLGNGSQIKNKFTYYTRLMHRDNFMLNGFLVFKKYDILFLQTRKSKIKFLFVLEKTADGFKTSLDFINKYPAIYTIINNSYLGKGTFKVIKEEI